MVFLFHLCRTTPQRLSISVTWPRHLLIGLSQLGNMTTLRFWWFKIAAPRYFSLFYPDYNPKSILRTDASEFGVGGILRQVNETETGEKQHLCSLMYHLRPFDCLPLNTRNMEFSLVYESLLIIKIPLQFSFLYPDWPQQPVLDWGSQRLSVRWLIFLQSFDFLIEHIPGTRNVVADALSRFLCLVICGKVVFRTMIQMLPGKYKT